jgi:hypothetical protein
VWLEGHGDIRRRELSVLRAQIDTDRGLAGSLGEVRPADLVRRGRAQQQLVGFASLDPAPIRKDSAPVRKIGGAGQGWSAAPGSGVRN